MYRHRRLVGCLSALTVLAGPVALAQAGDGGAAADGGPALVGDARCGPCHQKLLGRAVLHPKLSECSGCHVPTARPGPCRDHPERGWRLRRGAVELCRGCHAIAGRTDLHATIRGAGCKSCHDPHGTDFPKLLKKGTADALCKRCHQLPAPRYGHAPVLAGDCTECHDPHVGQDEPLLRERREAVCLRCHELPASGVAHTPVKAGNCLGCHQAHGAPRKHLVTAAQRAQCLGCHGPGRTKAPGAARAPLVLSGKSVHQPARERCDTCHLAGHAAAFPKLLRVSEATLCTAGCHAAVVQGRRPLHAQESVTCGACHQAHASTQVALLKAPPGAALCFECHDDEVQRRAVVHRPVADGTCSDCHAAHGSAQALGLVAVGNQLCTGCHALPVPAVPHQVLAEGGCLACHEAHGCGNPGLLLKPVNALCGGCHQGQRDGKHFAVGGHQVSGAADPRKQGAQLSCVSCHSPHGARFPHLLEKESPAESCRACHTSTAGKFGKGDVRVGRP